MYSVEELNCILAKPYTAILCGQLKCKILILKEKIHKIQLFTKSRLPKHKEHDTQIKILYLISTNIYKSVVAEYIKNYWLLGWGMFETPQVFSSLFSPSSAT